LGVNQSSVMRVRKMKGVSSDVSVDASQTAPQALGLVGPADVCAIFDSLGTATNLAVRPYLNQRKVPQTLLASGSVFWGTDYKKYPWTIGYIPDYVGEGTFYGIYIRNHIKNPKIAVLAQNDEYGDTY